MTYNTLQSWWSSTWPKISSSSCRPDSRIWSSWKCSMCHKTSWKHCQISLVYKLPKFSKLRKFEAAGNQLEAISAPFESPVLEYLDLSENKIAQLPPTAFKALIGIKVIDLHQNRLTAIGGFASDSKLETLLLSSNKLTKVTDLSAETVPELKVLDIKDNKVTEFEDQFFTLTKIHTLDLTNNEFNKLAPELGLFVALKKFFIVGNPLKTLRNEIKNGSTEKLKKYLSDLIDPNKIKAQDNSAKANLVKKELASPEEKTDFERTIRAGIVNNTANLSNKKLTILSKEILIFEGLSSVNLSKNGLTEFPTILSELRNLRTINLSENQIDRVSVSQLQKFDLLDTLDFQSNKLVSFCDDFVSYEQTPILRNLRSLDLAKNRLTQVSLVYASLPKLDTLSLGFNQITSIEPLIFQENNTLDTLILTNNKIETISENIANLMKLATLLAENNNIKNFPPEIAFLNLKNLSILGNPSILATEKMSSKGTAHILSYLKNKLSEEKIAKNAAMVKGFKPRALPAFEEPVKTAEEGKTQRLEQTPRKDTPHEGFGEQKTAEQLQKTPSDGRAAGFNLKKQVQADNLDIFGQPQHEKQNPMNQTAGSLRAEQARQEQEHKDQLKRQNEQHHKLVDEKNKAADELKKKEDEEIKRRESDFKKQVDEQRRQFDDRAPKPQTPSAPQPVHQQPAEAKRSTAQGQSKQPDSMSQFLPLSEQKKPAEAKEYTPEQQEIVAQINRLQNQLDTDFNLNNVKKLTIRKELNALRAKLNQG